MTFSYNFRQTISVSAVEMYQGSGESSDATAHPTEDFMGELAFDTRPREFHLHAPVSSDVRRMMFGWVDEVNDLDMYLPADYLDQLAVLREDGRLVLGEWVEGGAEEGSRDGSASTRVEPWMHYGDASTTGIGDPLAGVLRAIDECLGEDAG